MKRDRDQMIGNKMAELWPPFKKIVTKPTYDKIMMGEMIDLWRTFEKMLTDPLFVLVEVFSHGSLKDPLAREVLIDLLKQSHPPQRQISYMKEMD